jgi:hypothetical protein
MIHPAQKIFCVGLNKTGTTSLDVAFKQLGFRTAEAVHLLDDWAKRDFRQLIDLCQTADAFQDIPFSLPFTYPVLDYAFPNSKFILTVRNSTDEWYRSLTTFHTNLIGKGRLPTAEDLKASPILYDGWLWSTLHLIGGVDEADPYNRERWTRLYEEHNANILSYFRYRPESLLVLNLAEASAMSRLCAFLGVPDNGMSMPHITSDDIIRHVRSFLESKPV